MKDRLDNDIIELFSRLHGLRLDNGFYRASTSVDYKHTWLRDNFYCALPELWNNPEYYVQTYHTWLDYYKRIEKTYHKFSSLISKRRIDNDWEFPNPRINADLSEIHTGWNHVQIDQIGYFLYGIALGEDNGLHIIRDKSDHDIILKAIELLEYIDYIKVPESGAWEEGRENPRLSTIGIITEGLIAIEPYVNTPNGLISDGARILYSTLKETPTREYDMAQLFLLWPFNAYGRLNSTSNYKARAILKGVEDSLARENGVIRYINDQYFNDGGEAQWTMGFAYLGLIYAECEDWGMAKYYYEKLMASGYDIPELYLSRTLEPNDNKPLAWSLSLAIQLAKKLLEHYG